MERVAFLIEETNERLVALLNPESIQVRRTSGLRVLDGVPGTIAGAGGSDDLLIGTSGGRTEIEIDLVFDVDMVLTQPAPTDVRDLTGPIWRLSENSSDGSPQPFRLIWGRRWNVPLVIEAVSERFDRFDRAGNPLRSWLSMRALRIAEADEPPRGATSDRATAFETTPRAPSTSSSETRNYLVAATGDDGRARVDDLSDELFDGPENWRDIADQVDIDRLPWVWPGDLLTVDPSRNDQGSP